MGRNVVSKPSNRDSISLSLVGGFWAVHARDARCRQFVECVVVNVLVLPIGLLENQGQGINAARFAKFLFEPFFDTQDGLVDLF